MRTLAALSVTVILGVAVPAAASGPESYPRSGLYGHATKGPLTPVCTVSVPCYGPAVDARIAFRRAGVTTWVRVDADGDYRIALRPGRYTIRSKVGFGVVKPTVIEVKAGRSARADLMLDTGIR